MDTTDWTPCRFGDLLTGARFLYNDEFWIKRDDSCAQNDTVGSGKYQRVHYIAPSAGVWPA